MNNEPINELAAALAKAQGEMSNASKDTANPFFKSKYADLASVINAIKEPLSKNGLSYTQLFFENENGMYMTTMLMHSSGQSIKSVYPIRPLKNDPQGIGSAASYARRYSLAAIVGLTQEDDDGNHASKPQSPSYSAPQAQQQPRPQSHIASPKPPTLVSPEKIKSLLTSFEGLGVSATMIERKIKHVPTYLTESEFESLKDIGIKMKEQGKDLDIEEWFEMDKFDLSHM